MKLLLRTLLLLMIFLFSLITFLLTPSGLRTTISAAEYFLPGQLQIKTISGVIVGPIILKEIHYENKSIAITINKLRFDWSPLALLDHQFTIKSILSDNIIITIKNNKTDWTPDKIKSLIQTIIKNLQQKTFLNYIVNQAKFNQITINDPQHIDAPIILKKSYFYENDPKNNELDINFSSDLESPSHLHFSFLIHGTKKNYAITSSVIGTKTQWALEGHGDTHSINIITKQSYFLNGLLTLNGNVQLQPTQWQGQFIGKNIDLSFIDPRLVNHLQFIIKTQGSNLSSFTTKNNAHFSTNAGYFDLSVVDDKDLKIDWHLHTIDLSHWAEVLTGHFSSRGHIEGDLDNPSIHIEFNTGFKTDAMTLSNGKLTIDGSLDHHLITFVAKAPQQYINFKIDAHFKNEKWSGLLQNFNMSLLRNTQWRLKQPTTILATKNLITLNKLSLISNKAGRISIIFNWSAKKIIGRIGIHLTHFGWLQSFMPTLHIAAGAMDGVINLSGSLTKPLFTGLISFSKAQFIFPHLHVSLNDLTATIKSDGDKVLLDIKAFSQKQPIELKGDIDLSQPTLTADATITSNNLLFINTDEYVGYATANLTAKVRDFQVTLTGNIIIPKATIHPSDQQRTITLPDRDIVFVGSKKKSTASIWNLNMDISIILGNAVNINAAGLQGQLQGQLHINQMSNQVPTGTGEIFIKNGIYSIYGKTLTITSDSYLSYSDSTLTNPTLDVRATRMIQSVENMGLSNFSRENLLVGIEVTGSVKKPNISFFSNRANLSQSDILSYIVLGYGSSNSPGSTDFLLRALSAVDVTSQGLLGKENIASKIENGLGLNELGVESETTIDALGNPLNNQSAFVVGKNLTRRLYVRYSVGILDQVNVFQVRYLITPNWAVQADSSTLDNGGDVLYSIEKN